MSLYHETAELLTAPTNTGGSLKSRIFNTKDSKRDLKSPPAQIYALAIETCKWSPVLKEVVESVGLLSLERKLSPILSILLVHDLLLAKKGIALPATHGLRSSIERHKARIQAEFTKARIRRKIGTFEAFKVHIEQGLESSADTSEIPYPRWVRINTLKTTLEEQLDSTFAGLERATSVEAVRNRRTPRVYIDGNIPNLLAVSPSLDLSKSEAYRSGAIIFQDKASCFPAYLLDPLPEDGDIIDSCSAPGNKTTHLAAILLSHASDPDECKQTIHAFEKNKARAETLEKMVNLASSHTWTKLHPGHDFLKADPDSAPYRRVGALLLDPSCSGSGIIGRDEMPDLHLPILKQGNTRPNSQKKGGKTPAPIDKVSKKRKREDEEDINVMVDDDGEVTAVNTEDELKARLAALSDFQTELVIHAFKFPAARKITYSTCSIHAEENEVVVQKALDSAVAKERGWRIQRRGEQIRGMKEWPIRGTCDGELADACIRANKSDEHGTMGFFLACFVRDDGKSDTRSSEALADLQDQFVWDERGHMVRDMMGIPVRKDEENFAKDNVEEEAFADEETEWNGFGGEPEINNSTTEEKEIITKAKKPSINRHSHGQGKRPQLGIKKDKKRRRA